MSARLRNAPTPNSFMLQDMTGSIMNLKFIGDDGSVLIPVV